jgi:hypothetical protein
VLSADPWPDTMAGVAELVRTRVDLFRADQRVCLRTRWCASSLPAFWPRRRSQPTETVMANVNFTQCAVAFLDILGFKTFIAATEVDGSKESEQFRRLLETVDGQLQFTTDDPQEQHMFPKDVGLEIIHISDSFVLSAPINNENRPGYSGLVGVAIKTIQLAHQLLDMGFLLRGGIAVGSAYRTPTNIFGTCYQNAYETESCRAKTPRILLHQSAVERLEGDRHSGFRLGELPIFMKNGQQFILDTLFTHWSYIGNDRNCDLAKVFGGYKTT